MYNPYTDLIIKKMSPTNYFFILTFFLHDIIWRRSIHRILCGTLFVRKFIGKVLNLMHRFSRLISWDFDLKTLWSFVALFILMELLFFSFTGTFTIPKKFGSFKKWSIFSESRGWLLRLSSKWINRLPTIIRIIKDMWWELRLFYGFRWIKQRTKMFK